MYFIFYIIFIKFFFILQFHRYFRDNKGLTEEDIEKIFSFETLTEM